VHADSLPWWDHPASFQHRRQITVSTGKDAVPAHYSVSVVLDHAKLVREDKSLPGGADLRVARWTGSSWIELDRLVGESGWNQAATQIWFALQKDLPAFSTESSYYLYYHSHAVVAAPDDPTRVYYYYSNFSDPEAFSRDWSVYTVNGQHIQYAVLSGALYKEDSNSRQTDRLPYINDKVVLTKTGEKVSGLYVRYSYRAGMAHSELDDDLFGVGLCSPDAEPAGFYAGITGKDDWFDGSERTPPAPAQSQAAAGYWRGDEIDHIAGFSSPLVYELKSRHTVVAVWTSSSLAMWLDGAFISAWPVGPVADNYFCFVSQGMPDFFIDELMLRRLVDSEPVASLGPEQP